MTRILAVGRYSDVDAVALAAMGAQALPSAAALAALPAALRAEVHGVAFMGHESFGAAEMDLLPALRVIANFGVGYDNIDVGAATARKVLVTNTPEVLSDDVADLAVGMLIAQSRGFDAGIASVRSGDWQRRGPLPLARRVTGRRVGILGLGRIGREIADRLAGFKCQIHYCARTPRQTPGWTRHGDPLSLARAVDDLVVAVVGGEETRGLVSAEVIAALGPDGVLVNIARGSVVDEPALIAALEQGRLRGAALDVFWNEPAVDPRLAALPNLLPLPHVGSATVESRAAMGELQRRNLSAVLAGQAAVTPVNAP